jgi:lipopolysaccharide/colanic/teichoic acid biosynthesis glycosyltransferase
MVSIGWSGAAGRLNWISKSNVTPSQRRAHRRLCIVGSDQITARDSAAARNDRAVAFGIDPRIHRAFDLAAAAMGLILFAPILLVTSIAIKLDCRGPIFIREPQLGCNNRVIQIFKFRFVTARAESSICQRPTRIGRALAETGIDQLPQLFNVLRGEVSIADLLHAVRRDGIFRC